MMRAQERLYLTAEKDHVVRFGDPLAAFLYAAVGDEIPDSAAEKFGLVDGRLKPKAAKSTKPTPTDVLHGSSTLASTFEIGAKTVQLGALVAEAHKRSGLSVDQWNALPDAERDGLLGKVLDELKAAAAEKPETPPTRKPETPPTPKPSKKAAAKTK